MMKVLLTGITGYLGSHLGKAFIEAGHQVHGLIRKTSSLKRIDSVLDHLQLHFIEDSLEKAFSDSDTAYDAVIHTATCYGRHGESTQDIMQANLFYPRILLEKAIEHQVKLFINTDTVLDKNTNAYALTKKQFREWGHFYSSQQHIKFCNVLLEYMYGPSDDDSKFITHIVKSCLRNDPEIKLSPGEQKRDFIFITDVVAAYALLLEKVVLEREQPEFYQDVGLGSGESITLKDLVKIIHAQTASKSLLNFSAYPYRTNEVMDSVADLGKLQGYGWYPKTSLADGLKIIIDCENKS